MNVSEVGRRIATLRRRRGLSLSKLAELAGISKSTLSALESGRINPTISTLWSIANALNVPFGELIPEVMEVDESGVSVRLIERSIGPRMEVYRMILRPRSLRRAEAHRIGVVERITVVSGSMIAGPIYSPKFLRAGEEFEFRADVPHIYLALDEGARAIVTIMYPDDDFRYDLIATFPNVEIGDLVYDRAFRIVLHGERSGEDLMNLRNSLSGLKYRIVEQGDRLLVYIFPPIRLRIQAPDNIEGEVSKVSRLLRRERRLSKEELIYLENLVDCPSPLLSVLAYEALLAHGHTKVPKIGLENPKALRPGYALQVLFVASVLRMFLGERVNGTIVGDETHRIMLNELLWIEEGSDVLISFDPNAIRNFEGYDLLIVCGDFIAHGDGLERWRNIVLHRSRLMVELPYDVSERIPLIAYLADVGEIETAMSQAFILHGELHGMEIRDPFHLLQRLELSEIVEGSTPSLSVFKSILERHSFSLLHDERILETRGGGIHVLVFGREGWDVQRRTQE